MKKEIETQWQHHDLDEIIRYFAEGFKPVGKKILRYEFWVDTYRRSVVFSITTERQKDEGKV